MSGFVPFAFSDAQKIDIRRFCGYPTYSDGSVLFPAPWVNVQYLALEYRLNHMSAGEAAVLTNTYLEPLAALEAAVVKAGCNLDTDQAGPWVRNRTEVRDRERLFDGWRRRLCRFMGVQPGPELGQGGGTLQMVV